MVQDSITAHIQTGVLTAPVVPAGPVISNFGLTPARVNTNIIDYTTKEEIGLYNIATKLLYKKKKKSFDMTNDVFYPFMVHLQRRSNNNGWTETVIIIIINTTTDESKSLLIQFGEIIMAQVQIAITQFDGQ